MRFYACWLLADPQDAVPIRTRATAEPPQLADWPHLILTQVDSPEINHLERLLRPREKGKRSATGGKLLARGKMTDEPFIAVSLVESAFVQRLAELAHTAAGQLAQQWQKKLSGVTEAAATTLLNDMTTFARQAVALEKPVLQLDIL